MAFHRNERNLNYLINGVGSYYLEKKEAIFLPHSLCQNEFQVKYLNFLNDEIIQVLEGTLLLLLLLLFLI